jgi:hypothetical protein
VKFVNVQSSNLKAVAHDGDSLFVQFHKGPVYRYIGVSEQMYHQLLEAPSVGKFFVSEIRDRFQWEVVTQTVDADTQ